MGWLIRGVEGDEELWKVIWIYGAFFVFLSQVVSVALRLLCDIDFDHPTLYEATFLTWLERFYCLWMLVSLWRCAFFADWKIWGYFVRAFVILFILLFGLFSLIDARPVEPKDVITTAGFVLEWEVTKWLKEIAPGFHMRLH